MEGEKGCSGEVRKRGGGDVAERGGGFKDFKDIKVLREKSRGRWREEQEREERKTAVPLKKKTVPTLNGRDGEAIP